MSKRGQDDMLYYHGDAMTRVLIEHTIERLSDTDRLNLAARLAAVARQLHKKRADLQQAATDLQAAWEVLGIKYLAPPPNKKGAEAKS